MLVLFYCAASKERGIGHLSRCAALADILEKKSTYDVHILCECDNNYTAFSKRKKGHFHSVGTRQFAQKMARQILEDQGAKKSLLITDLLDFTEEEAACARKDGFSYLVHINDTVSYDADLYFDGDLFPKQIPSVRGRYYCGAKYQITPPNLLSFRPQQPWKKKQIESVLISLGGADPGRETERLSQFFDDLDLAIDVTIVAGLTFDFQRVKRLHTARKSQVISVANPEIMAELILQHDLILTMGGLTSYEAMFLGRPVSAILWDEMAPYVKALEKEGFVYNLGLRADRQQRFQELLAHPEHLELQVNKAWNCLDGRGGERIVDLLIKELEA